MALFDRLAQRVADRASDLAGEARDRIGAALDPFPDMKVRREGDSIVIEAMGLMRRWICDVQLRFALWRSR